MHETFAALRKPLHDSFIPSMLKILVNSIHVFKLILIFFIIFIIISFYYSYKVVNDDASVSAYTCT